jgi:hypothetical protein
MGAIPAMFDLTIQQSSSAEIYSPDIPNQFGKGCGCIGVCGCGLGLTTAVRRDGAGGDEAGFGGVAHVRNARPKAIAEHTLLPIGTPIPYRRQAIIRQPLRESKRAASVRRRERNEAPRGSAVTIERVGTALRAFARLTESALNPILANLCWFDRFSVAVSSCVEAAAITCFTATKPRLQRLRRTMRPQFSDRI